MKRCLCCTQLLLEDPDYQWDAVTGNCSLATVYHFEGVRDRIGNTSTSKPSDNLSKHHVNSDMFGHLEVKMEAPVPQQEVEFGLFNGDLLSGGDDPCWGDGAVGGVGEFEWESFLSFGAYHTIHPCHLAISGRNMLLVGSVLSHHLLAVC